VECKKAEFIEIRSQVVVTKAEVWGCWGDAGQRTHTLSVLDRRNKFKRFIVQMVTMVNSNMLHVKNC
jgi:hypothetical protein